MWGMFYESGKDSCQSHVKAELKLEGRREGGQR